MRRLKKYETNLKYVGNIDRFPYNCTDSEWHIVMFVNSLEGEMLYVLDMPHYEGDYVGYSGMDAKVVSEQELCDNFMITKNGKVLAIKPLSLL